MGGFIILALGVAVWTIGMVAGNIWFILLGLTLWVSGWSKINL